MMQLVLAANWRMNMECRGTSWPSPVGPPLLLLLGLDSGPGKNRLQRFIEQPLFGDSTQLYILTALPGIGGINRSQCNMLVWQSKTYHPVKQHRPCQIGGWKVSFHYTWAIFRVYVDWGEGKVLVIRALFATPMSTSRNTMFNRFIHGFHPQIKGMELYMLVASTSSRTYDTTIIQPYDRMNAPMNS